MELFSRFKKLIACIILSAFIPSQAWAQGITIPAGSSLNINTGQLTVPGNITNAGTLASTTGNINLIGNWTNSGTFNAGTSTVNFNAASGTQVLNSGGTAGADTFYNLNHGTAGTVQLNSNAIAINNNFTNTLGTFNANSLNMTVDGNWENTAAFTPGTNTVTLNGTNQSVLGTTSFYDFSKIVASGGPYTLTFDATGGALQTFTDSLTMRGNSSENLNIRSTTNGVQADIVLLAGHLQSINDVNVQDSNAGTTPADITLVGRGNSLAGPGGNNVNWNFGNTTITWVGGISTEWQNVSNWDKGVVPADGDTVIIPGGTTYEPDLCPSVHTQPCAAVNVGNLTIDASASLNLTGQNLTVTSAFSNLGNVNLEGNETLELTMDSTHGTFTYVGQGGGASVPQTLALCTSPTPGPSTCSNNVTFNNLAINDVNAHMDTFVTNGTLTVNGSLTVSSGTLNISTNSDAMTVSGTLFVNGANGILTATSGNIAANGIVNISAGTFTAPGTGKTFTVTGNFIHTGGTFNNSSGLVTLNGGDQTVSGTTTFYQFAKTVSTAHTLTFDHTGTQTFTNALTLGGASGQLLSIASDLPGTAADIALSPGGTQVLNFLSVQDSNAGVFPAQVTLVPNNSIGISDYTNWIFGGVTDTWTGTTSTNWNTPSNWDKGFAPRASDTVVIPNGGSITFQPVLFSAVQVVNLTINNGSSLTLSGFNLTVTPLGAGTFNNSGTLILEGNEVVTLTMDSTHGTFEYVGDGDTTQDTKTLTVCAASCSPIIAFNNLTINDTNATPANRDIFQANGAITLNGNLNVSSGTFDASNSNSSLAADGNVTITSPGILKAPSTGHAFTVTGNWADTGTFNNSSGLVTLNGTSQTVSGTTVFYQFAKTVASAATLTFDHTGLQTFSNSLTLQGAVGQLLSIRSDLLGTQANIILDAGGTQAISEVNVQYSNAGTPPADITLIARTNSVDAPPGGTNTNWQFGNATLTWKGGTGSGATLTDWNTASNWDLGIVPIPGDTVIIPGATTYEPVLSSAVSVGNLTIASGAGASLTLNGNNLTVSTTFSNNGNVNLDGNEALTLTMDSTHGTFTYVGAGGGSSVTQTLTINSSVNLAFNNLVINDVNTHQDIFSATGTLAVNGNFTLASGTFDAPPAGKSFSVAGNFTKSGGTFNADSGAVTFTTAATTIITGNTTFYDFVSSTAGKTIEFTAGSDQTVTHTLNLTGLRGSPILLLSTTTGSGWDLTFPNGAQSVGELSVEDSTAVTNSVTCLNCTDLTNNHNWIFSGLSISAPANGTTIGQVPTLIGLGPANSNVYIRDISANLVATAKADVNGNFRVVVGTDAASTGLPITTQLATGANSLTPYLTPALINAGLINNVTVTATPSVSQVPDITGLNCPPATPNCSNITNPNTTQFISGSTPTFAGQGLANQPVTVQALDANGNLILSAGSGTVTAGGTYSVTLTTPLPSATNYISVTVGSSINETASALLEVSLTDPFGYVYNSSNNQVIQGATVTLINNTTKQAATGVKSCTALGVCTSANPFVTDTDGFYSFLAPPGQYYLNVSAAGYSYPSKVTAVPAGRSVNTGSKGEVFTVGAVVFELDQPMDGNSMLLRITKTANKSDGSVGDIVTYTVNIQNLSSTNPVDNVFLNDKIPPGFKYIKDRVILNSTPLGEPSGERPLIFNVGSIPVSATEVLQYQLVIGSGVTMGTYKNTATAQFGNGIIISNPAEASVRIVPDPVFDLGSVIGKVFFDWNENGIQDPPYFDPISHETIVEKPVPNVQIVMEDGTIITTDRDGKYNIPGLLPGRHLFRLDERTLPPGAYMTTDKTVIADITAGSIAKVNFGVNIDESQTKGRDAVFFNEKIRLTQDPNRPVPRLNAAIFDASANADPKTEEVVLYQGALVRQAEFRIFTNYSPFMSSWHLDIIDADTKKSIRQFTGTALNINDPIYWNGRDDHDVIIGTDRQYSYVLSVVDDKNNTDDTKEKPITVREIKDDLILKKEREETKDILKDRADRYRKWLDAEVLVNNLDHQLITVKGETIHLDRQGTDVKSIKVMKGDKLFMDIPLSLQYGLTPDELLAGGFSSTDEKDNLEVILPNGDYSIDVISAKVPGASAPQLSPSMVPESVPTSGGMPSRTIVSSPGSLEHYSRPLKVGDDYMMFVALGDAQAGYNIDTGNIEPIQDKTQEPGFYHEGKGAYYLKGQILGKYLITSSYDSDRAEKALFRQLDPNTYYPVYGDSSTVNYDAADTQGALYLKVEWDKSSAILGNYAVDFSDTDFAAFSRSYYGGKLDYQSVANNPYGDARTKLVVYHAQVQQLPSHNEFLATGGSLYFLKYKNVIQGSDVVTIQVRDETTGLVIATQTMTNGADYELDESQGRILFWQPVAMIAQSENIISNSLINGDPIYVVVDYQYAASDLQTQASQGARIAQGIGDNVVLGGTYVQDNSGGQNYTLEGTDATLHVTKDATIKAEYAQSTSQDQSSYVSTDGGITFSNMAVDNTATGKAYGIKGDARLFDNIGLKSYYKWVGSDFGATSDTSQQGKESMGLSMTFDMSPVTRVTASEDIQRLLAGGNLQTSAQVGASETDTTIVEVVHTAEKVKMTGEFQMTEVKNVVNGITSTTNQKGASIGGQAQYDLTSRIKLTLGQQLDVVNRTNNATTLGAAIRATDHTTFNIIDVFNSQGRALTAGVTNQVGSRIALTTNYTLTNLNTGEVDKTASVGIEDKINKNITTTGSVAMTGSSMGTTTTFASIGTKAQIAQGMTMDLSLGKSQNSTGAQGSTSLNLNGTTQIGNTTVTGTATALASGGAAGLANNPLSIGTTGVSSSLIPASTTATSSVGVQAVTKVDSNNTTNGSVNVATDETGAKTTTFGFGNNSKLDQELQAVTDNSFSFSPASGTTDSSKYGLVRTQQNGQKLEADYTNQLANQPGTITESNIYGLTGDVNDKLALNGSIERGKVQNLDTSQTTRTDITLGSGYVLKDTETAEARLKNSMKLELRIDRGIGTDSLRQYVLYDAIDGKITDNWSVNAKVDYSKTLDTTNNAVAERHQEIILGTAYRPVNFDSLNLIAEYSYQDGYGGGLQQADALNSLVQKTTNQVVSVEGVYDINDQWQLAEKAALRIQNEQDTGFQFTQTHTWLVIHRLNYKIDRNWTISGEYRDLAQVEAKDNKQGLLLEATREINNNTELGIGWNFTSYNDDLTNLSYTSQGPFVRMTGKFYDETPEEKARARAKWLDARISEWAWVLIRKELAKKDSKIVIELNRMFALAKKSEAAGRLEESRQIYKDIIAAGQMMFDEASEYIRGRINFEEQMQTLDRTAQDYFKGGEYVKARKIWEKVVDEASKGVVK